MGERVILGIFLLNFKNDKYDKCSKISNTFFFLFSNKMLGYRAEAQKLLVRVANSEDCP